MELASLVYRNHLESTGLRKRVWSFARKMLIDLFNDPTCSMMVHGRHLKLPLSHSLPLHLQHHPFYDSLPQRIGRYLHQKKEHIHCIDVGANIGDTIASFYNDDKDEFLAIEPNSKFYKLLVENWSENDNITFVPDICSSKSRETAFVVQEKAGTASILPSENGIEMSERSLDDIVRDYPSAAKANILKIDTDGHDFEVIQGAIGLLSENMPIVLFECDAFSNKDYVESCLRTLQIFKQCGYKRFLLYDNFGNIMGNYSLSDLAPFRNLLFYQLTSSFYYFDILVMPDEDMTEFYKAEVNSFTEKIPDKSLQRAAVAAAEL